MPKPNRSAILLLFAVAACDSGGGERPPLEPEVPVRLEAVGGGERAGLPGEPLAEPLVVRATREERPAAAVTVLFEARGGTMEPPARGTTDAEGLVRLRWTPPAGAEFESARAIARVAGAASADSVVFTLRRLQADELTLVLAEPGVEVDLLVYPRNEFAPGRYLRRTFTDSTHLQRFVTAQTEVVAFTPGRAPLLLAREPVPGRDTIRVRFREEVIRIPLTIWVLAPPFDSTMVLVRQHLEGVHDAWEAQAGIGLGDVRIMDATAYPEAGRYTAEGRSSCDNTIRERIGWDAGRINAYYTGQARINEIVPSAAHCLDAWIEIYPLAWQRFATILAHEIGHAFLGGHHETIPDNIMHFRGEGHGLSEGQRFQAHHSNRSLLNTLFLAHPPALQRPCSPLGGGACMPTSFVLEPR